MTADFSLEIPKFENPFEDNQTLSELELHISHKLREEGFCVFDFPEENFDSLASNLISKLTEYFAHSTPDGKLKPGLRLQDAVEIEEVKRIASNKSIIDILTNVYGRKAFPFQTLNFPSGTQQGAHSDHIHFDSLPHKFMAGVWLALEDIDEENGPIFYYPGSHKWPALTNIDIGCHSTKDLKLLQSRFASAWEAYAAFYGVEKQFFHAKKGQCLIWASNLVHGGAPHQNTSRTRWSQVTHFYFDECAYFTPMLSTPHAGYFHWRKVHDLFTNELKQNIVNGYKVTTLSDSVSRELFNFDPDKYLELNKDVKAAGVDPYHHFLNYGFKEGRKF